MGLLKETVLLEVCVWRGDGGWGVLSSTLFTFLPNAVLKVISLSARNV